MQSRVSSPTALIPAAFLLLFSAASLKADTVFLKNGAYIDGLVASRSSRSITIKIGAIGRLEVSMEDVVRVEKNSRTGSQSYVPVDERELPDFVKEKNRATASDQGEDGEGEQGDAEGSSEEGEKSDGGAEVGESSDGEEGEEGKEGKDEEKELDPELKADIETLVKDLQRHKSKHRRRAERKLQRIGAPAVPFLLPLVARGGDLTRITALRLVSQHAEKGDPEVIEVCLKALIDENYFVRDYAAKTLRRLTSQSFGYKANAGNRLRKRAERKWRKWWTAEKERLEDEAEEEKG